MNKFSIYDIDTIKDDRYFSFSRPEMATLVPLNAKRILDVGCGGGNFGASLKRRQSCIVDGVEIVTEKAAEARRCIDSVYEGAFESTLPLSKYIYDCVVFNDVLEHMIHPNNALVYAQSLLSPTGCVVASIPNIRHFPTVWKLAVRGQWNYVGAGTLDNTHLRFFTRSSITSLFMEAGYTIKSIVGINRYCVNHPDEHKLWRYFKLLRLLSPSRFNDMCYLQFAIVAGISK